jgi:hypothetical protein
MRLEGSGKLKNPMTSSGIEATSNNVSVSMCGGQFWTMS